MPHFSAKERRVNIQDWRIFPSCILWSRSVDPCRITTTLKTESTNMIQSIIMDYPSPSYAHPSLNIFRPCLPHPAPIQENLSLWIVFIPIPPHVGPPKPFMHPPGYLCLSVPKFQASKAPTFSKAPTAKRTPRKNRASETSTRALLSWECQRKGSKCEEETKTMWVKMDQKGLFFWGARELDSNSMYVYIMCNTVTVNV